jgi:hypothetical protein
VLARRAAGPEEAVSDQQQIGIAGAETDEEEGPAPVGLGEERAGVGGSHARAQVARPETDLGGRRGASQQRQQRAPGEIVELGRLPRRQRHRRHGRVAGGGALPEIVEPGADDPAPGDLGHGGDGRGDGALGGDGVGDHLGDDLVGEQLAQRRQRSQRTAALQQRVHFAAAGRVLDPVEEAQADVGPRGQVGQLGATGARDQQDLPQAQALQQRRGQLGHRIFLLAGPAPRNHQSTARWILRTASKAF